jgi:hypothetical protein
VTWRRSGLEYDSTAVELIPVRPDCRCKLESRVILPLQVERSFRSDKLSILNVHSCVTLISPNDLSSEE